MLKSLGGPDSSVVAMLRHGAAQPIRRLDPLTEQSEQGAACGRRGAGHEVPHRAVAESSGQRGLTEILYQG